MKTVTKYIVPVLIIFSFGLIPATVCQFFTKPPQDRNILIRSFRYGKEPSVIKCNRGDRLHLTFSTDDTGHSFFLEEFDMDVKVSPARKDVFVFKTSDPTQPPVQTKEVLLVAKHPGLQNYIVSKSNYRCHVWCGPMHAFEQGKLIILPNTLLVFSLGCLIGVIFLWLVRLFKPSLSEIQDIDKVKDYKPLFAKSKIFYKILTSRWLQITLTLLTMLMIYIVILTSIFGTKVSGRNLGVLMMWAIWLFLLVAILTPFLGRIWCTICPLPFLGDLFQRQSFFNPVKGNTRDYNNEYSGYFLKWPSKLSKDWLRLLVFLTLGTFSTTLVAKPIVSGITVLMLLLVPTLMAMIWELRSFCRYVCPVNVFVGSFSRMSMLAVRNKSQDICDRCKSHYCQKGSAKGWACPYGINVGELNGNADCGMCLECTRSCLYNNVTLYRRPFASELGTRNMSEAWLTIAIFMLAIVYSILYEGHWPIVRDYVNILDKNNWGLFGIYALILWIAALIILPGILFLLSSAGVKLSKTNRSLKEVFMASTGSLLPLGLMLWIAFVIPMLFVNVTFIAQSASDPFGWGWDFFGTANIPWHQFIPQFIPWIQAILILTGTFLSLRNLNLTFLKFGLPAGKRLLCISPVSIFIILVVIGMLFFYTN